MKNHF